MRPHGVKELMKVLEAMAEAEMAMAELYKTCAQLWEQESNFWLSLSNDEVKHAENVRKLAHIIHNRLGSKATFQFYRPFTLNSVQSFVSGVTDAMARIKQDNVSEKRMLAIALDIELSALERRYSELVKTDDIEYQTISKTIDNETKIHRDRIEGKLRDQKH